MTREELAKCGRQLRSAWPLFGAGIRRRACARLAADPTAQAVPLLAEALRSTDADVSAIARGGLQSFDTPDAIDALCTLWVDERRAELAAIIAERGYVAAQLGAIIQERRYVASTPLSARVLSALKTGQPTMAVESAEAIPVVVVALGDQDLDIKQTARVALREASAIPVVDAICAAWAKDRQLELGAIIQERGYVASGPLPVRVLSALKTAQLEMATESADTVPLLVAALADPDETVKLVANRALRGLRDRRLVDALCRLAMDDPAGPAAPLCQQEGKRPSDPEDRALFLFVTRQLDAYFEEDDEFQNLRPAYERASEKVKSAVLDVVRSGDRRCSTFISVRSKPLAECNEREIRTAIDSTLRHQDWPRLFQMFLELPLGYGYPLLEPLRASGWSPAEAHLVSLFNEAVRAWSEAPRIPPPAATSSVFEKWLAEGANGPLGRESETELVTKLEKADPPDGVKIVGALSTKKQLPLGTAEKLQRNEHWLIRLAGYTTGLVTSLGKEAAEDPNHWVRELAGAAGVLNLWPMKATPADLEKLNDAPAEASVGKLGNVRRVLRLLVAYRMTAPVLEPVVVEVAGDAPVLERAD